uniref:RRM domain-containing protein n=1 Tax=Leersia perrieri TaxID=77586 RepID=A0A0D9VZI1_9ORYZ
MMLEERKLFVASLPWKTREGDLRGHFARYGEVVHARVVLDLESGRSRGFGFVEFADAAATGRALAEAEMPNHVFLGRKVDVKRAERRLLHKQTEQSLDLHNSNHDKNDISNKKQFISQKKLFVGGLHESITEKEFVSYFEKFGEITNGVVIHDRITNRPRGFGFISFYSNEAVRKVLENRFHDLNGKSVEVKMAIPKSQTYLTGQDHRLRILDTNISTSYYNGMYTPYTSPYYMNHLHPYFYAQHTFDFYGSPMMACQDTQVIYSGYGYGGPTGHNLVDAIHDFKIDSKSNSISIGTDDTIKTELDKQVSVP